MTLNSLNANASTGAVNDNKRVTMLGSMLFLRCVSGSRVVSTVEQKELTGYKFEGNMFPFYKFFHYLTKMKKKKSLRI